MARVSLMTLGCTPSPGLLVVDDDLQLRCLGQALRARARQLGPLISQADELFTRRDHLFLPQAAQVLQEELNTGAAAQAAHGGWLRDEDQCVAHPAPQFAAETLGQRASGLLALGALGPVGQADETLARTLVTTAATHHVVVRHLGLLGRVGLDLQGHGFHAFTRCARRRAHLHLQAALVFVGQEGRGQAGVQPGRGADEQQEDGKAAQGALAQPADPDHVTFSEAVGPDAARACR